MNSDSTAPLLSVVIPTRNRPNYLIVLLDELLTSPRNDFEIVVQDNSDDDSLRAELAGRSDDRIRYEHRAERLSVVENCDLAVDRARGGFVCMLGDDDGLLLEESLELAKRCLAAGIDAVVPGALYYTWPSLVHKTWGAVGGRLYDAHFGGQLTTIDVDRERDTALANGGAFGLYRMPRVYQGFVARAALARLRAAAGTCFPGPSPDMANAVALTKVIGRCIHADFPYVIMGHSKGSGGGMGAEKKHRGDLARQAHLPADTCATWNAAVPFFWSGPTIYAQSAHRALAAMWSGGDAPHINHACLYASCLVYERHFWRETLTAMRASGEPALGLWPRTLGNAGIIVIRRARSFIGNLLLHARRSQPVEPTNTIADAIHQARDRLRRQGVAPALPGSPR